MEQWKDIPGFEDYEASTLGNIRRKYGKILKVATNKDGYKYCTLYSGSRDSRKTIGVHQVIAKTFLTNPLNKSTVDHINRIRDDNRVENLRFATRSEQCFNTVRQNRLGLKYISSHTTGVGYKIQSKTYNINKYCPTLEEAINYRDMVLVQNITDES